MVGNLVRTNNSPVSSHKNMVYFLNKKKLIYIFRWRSWIEYSGVPPHPILNVNKSFFEILFLLARPFYRFRLEAELKLVHY
ncbi:hypothetical protein VNO77_13580 [Canavalia gladiata]|uniref:Uncharacterized protein n=1 Tax=Canavalia gladiata TaxID=3824 RepID=A0AAN9LY49_CANGL